MQMQCVKIDQWKRKTTILPRDIHSELERNSDRFHSNRTLEN